MNLDPFLTFGKVRLLNVPCMDVVAAEIFDQDCYELDLIPVGSVVLDVGAFYGAFAIRCAVEKRCIVIAYEPSRANGEILDLNVSINAPIHQLRVRAHAVGAASGTRAFLSRPDHPAGSMFASEAAKYGLAGVDSDVHCTTIGEEISFYRSRDLPLVVKLDCEGAEHEIFSDTAWLKHVDVLVMEWHNRDGMHFKEVLESHGFEASIAGCGPKPRPKWEPGMAGGLLWAKKRR